VVEGNLSVGLAFVAALPSADKGRPIGLLFSRGCGGELTPGQKLGVRHRCELAALLDRSPLAMPDNARRVGGRFVWIELGFAGERSGLWSGMENDGDEGPPDVGRQGRARRG
jgi:hypothetical protein